ncbi:sugar ABC transporter substrate-binding protein [Alkalilacustris brevis]|uniref:sugar ABC transporter substrate-binding protein n=1 Tax=Alkalilacustris brevis TaxID=2026338 RepID=UPI000E0DDC44|nr:sugar ABC transporter substrate-binding protein [Alkalilacustris brevis]
MAGHHLHCITKNGTNPAYFGARIGVGRVAGALGCTVTSTYPETPDDPDEQAELLATALAAKPDAIMLAPAHPTRLNSLIAQVRAAGIPLVCFVSYPEGGPEVAPDCFVTSDNFALAEGIARYLIDFMGGAGRFVLVEGAAISPTSPPRTEGFEKALAAYPAAQLVDRCVGNYQRPDALAAMTDLLARTPDFDGILCANDFMAMGVIDALEAAGKQAELVSVNAMPDAIAAIKAGKMRATAAFDAMKIACAATHAAVRLIEGKPVPKVLELPVEIVDAGNCAQWDRPYEERDLPDWQALTGTA